MGIDVTVFTRAAKISTLISDADLDLATYNIILAAGRTVDGTDISALDNAGIANRTRKIFIPLGEVENCTKHSLGGFETQNMNSATARIHGTCIVPPDYVSDANIRLIYIAGGVNKACSVLCDTPNYGEAYTTGGSTGITTIPGSTNTFLEILSLGFTLTGVEVEDTIGFYVDSDDNVNIYAVGFIFGYTADM